MNRDLFSFHKLATIDVLTGRTGAGKTTLADKLAPKYDLVIQTDMPRPLDPKTGKYEEPTEKKKADIRSRRLAEIITAHAAGKAVLVEGHPPGVVKLLKGHLPEVRKILLIPLTEKESFERVVKRAKEDPDERVVSIDIESAKIANDKYDKYFKKLEASGVPIVEVGKEKAGSLLSKMAAPLAAPQHHQEKLDAHFSSHEKTRWRDFRRHLRAKGFVEAVKQDDRSDDKLKRFAEMIGRHHGSKDPGVPVKGSSGKTYKVKFHEDIKRFSCNCNHWIYDLSHQTSEGADCKHIKQVKSSFQKQADMQPLLRGIRGLQVYSTHKDEETKARITNDAFNRHFKMRRAG